MQLFDSCVFPFPSGSVSISRYARELKDFGFSGFVACGVLPGQASYGIPIWSARYLSGIQAHILIREAGKPVAKDEVVYVQAGDVGFNRTVLQAPGVHVLMDIQNTPKDSFDRYCAQIAADREVGIGLSVRPLLELREVARQKIIRRYEEIFTLQSRYEFPLVLSSHALDITHLKSPREMVRLFSIVWDDEDLLTSSMASIPGIKNRTGPVREI